LVEISVNVTGKGKKLFHPVAFLMMKIRVGAGTIGAG
jgi:hypothetical protein